MVGQAKKRGTRADRVFQAQAIQQREEPINIPCKTCNEALNGFEYAESLPSGAFWKKECQCGATTFALVQAKNSTLERTFKSSLSRANELTGGDIKNKVSVAFLEKNLDTIETGLIRI